MPQQIWSAEGYQHHAAFVSTLGEELVSWLNPRPGERVLDLGCGDGRLTEMLAASGASVVGADRSPEMARAARQRRLDVVVVDGQQLPFDSDFDAVFSNAAMHWMPDADAVAAGVHRALRPGGRFVAEFGGHGCVAAIQTALRAVLATRSIALGSPWYFPTDTEYADVLERNGFELQRIVLFPRPTPLPTGIRGWLDTFTGHILGTLPAPERAAIMSEVERLLAPALRDTRGEWTADYVRVRFAARKR
jgi:SAM-dependent methyltransferase